MLDITSNKDHLLLAPFHSGAGGRTLTIDWAIKGFLKGEGFGLKALAFVALCVSVAFAADVYWTDTYNYSTHDELIGVSPAWGDGFLAVGGSWDQDRFYSGQLILRYDDSGNIEWTDFYHTGAGTFAFDACRGVTSNNTHEFVVVGTTDWAPGYTPDVMLTRYNDNGNRLEVEIYENYGIGTSVATTTTGDIVIGGVTTSNHPQLMMIDGDDWSNILWNYTYSSVQVDENWMRVPVDVNQNNEIAWGFTSEEFWSELYEKWAHCPYLYIFDTSGNITDYVELTAYIMLNGSGVLSGIGMEGIRGSTIGMTVSVLHDSYDDGVASITYWDVTNGDAAINDYCLETGVLTEDAFSNGIYGSTCGALFDCFWASASSAWIYGFSSDWTGDPFFQKFDSDGDLLDEKVHSGSESIIRGPEFHLGDGQHVGAGSHAIAMTRGSANSSDCYVEFWEPDTHSSIVPTLNDTAASDCAMAIRNNCTAAPVVEFNAPAGDYSIELFDMSGRSVGRVEGNVEPGEMVSARIPSNGSLATATYLARVISGSTSETSMVTVIK